MSKDFIGFRLRKVADADLVEVIDKKTGEEISSICRQALREAFGISTQKQKVVQFIDVPVTSSVKVWKPKTN